MTTKDAEKVLASCAVLRDTIVISQNNKQAGIIELKYEDGNVSAIVCLFADNNPDRRIISFYTSDDREFAIYKAWDSVGDRLADEHGICLYKNLTKENAVVWRQCFANADYRLIDVQY